jgi:hypothetical protein
MENPAPQFITLFPASAVQTTGATSRHAFSGRVSGSDRPRGEFSRERSTKRLISCDERPQTFIDLTIFPLSALLDRLHDKQPHADHYQSDYRQSDEGSEESVPGTEINHIAHEGGSKS